jgi:hypothetical protein
LVMAVVNLWRRRRTIESAVVAMLVLPVFLLVVFVITRPIE